MTEIGTRAPNSGVASPGEDQRGFIERWTDRAKLAVQVGQALPYVTGAAMGYLARSTTGERGGARGATPSLPRGNANDGPHPPWGLGAAAGFPPRAPGLQLAGNGLRVSAGPSARAAVIATASELLARPVLQIASEVKSGMEAGMEARRREDRVVSENGREYDLDRIQDNWNQRIRDYGPEKRAANGTSTVQDTQNHFDRTNEQHWDILRRHRGTPREATFLSRVDQNFYMPQGTRVVARMGGDGIPQIDIFRGAPTP